MKRARCQKLPADHPIIIDESANESDTDIEAWRSDFLRLLDSPPRKPASLAGQDDTDLQQAQRVRDAQEAERQRVRRREEQQLAEREAEKIREDRLELLSQLRSSDKEVELQAMAQLLELAENESQDEVATPSPPPPRIISAPRGVCWHLMVERPSAEESTSAMHEEILRRCRLATKPKLELAANRQR